VRADGGDIIFFGGGVNGDVFPEGIVVANLDASDVGRIRPGQHVSFRVDAYPAEMFDGSVSQVRLQPIVQQNVVTYATVIDVPNPALKLKPGMTANVNVEINKRTNVLRIPNAGCDSGRQMKCSQRC
jgi:multidrug efflux pump subunit AcrA (membrane-fusion protein)